MKLPLGITLGDANGVGPEILLKSFRDSQIPADLIVFGEIAALQFYNRELGFGVRLRKIQLGSNLEAGALNVVDSGKLAEGDIRPGTLSRETGSAARTNVVAATQAALAGQIAGVVTLPINKAATQMSDPGFVGHTELIGALCGVSDVTIMLASPQLIVTHVSTHCSLQEAIERAKRERIQTIIKLTSEAARKLIPDARIAVAGLNPHAGEGGLFGREEIEEIEPAIQWAKSQGISVDGPFPPDTLFHLAVKKRMFDVIVCMYHDQGHIPLKLLDFEGGVNIAVGLPLVRTSVDHGTAFDIAGQGKADIRSFLTALEYATRLSRA